MGLCPPSLCCALGGWDAPLTWQAAGEVQMMSVCLPCCFSWHQAPEPEPRALGVRGLQLRLPAPSPACGSAGLLQPRACCWFQLCGFLLRLAWSHGAGWSCVFDLPSMEPAAPARAAGWGRRYPGPHPVSGVGWGRDGLCPTAEGEAWPCSLGKALALCFAVPGLRERVAAEITLQENPFPPYLPSGTRLVAYIKVDDLLLPSLLP